MSRTKEVLGKVYDGWRHEKHKQRRVLTKREKE